MTSARVKPNILSVGRLYCDLIFTDLPRMPSLGTEVFAEGFSAHAGGGAFITAAHLADLECRSALAAMLPPAPFKELMRPELEGASVDLSLCRSLPPEAGPQVTVAMVHSGDRAFLTRRAGPALPEISSDMLVDTGVQHLHIGELASLVERPDLLEVAQKAQVTVSLDCSWDESLTAADIAPFLGRIDVFLPNESEHKRLSHLGLLSPMARVTVVKRGARGASALTSDGTIDAPTLPLEAVDTTGAGDAFNAGFLNAWLRMRPLADCLAAGNLRGGLAVNQRGGFTHPTEPLPDRGRTHG
ncbi:MAG: PfkB family carbohydrate kinase [Rhodobacteraceae bacterium]|nr:PfkB family carbohydrate kinase [Paracoccaceae bacterium]